MIKRIKNVANGNSSKRQEGRLRAVREQLLDWSCCDMLRSARQLIGSPSQQKY